MKRLLYIFTLISLLIGLTVILGCAGSQEKSAGNSSEIEGFCTVVEMNGKELTIGAPTFSGGGDSHHYAIVAVVVKNTGIAPIQVAELEIVYWDQLRDEKYPHSIVAEDLVPGDIQTLYVATNFNFFGSIKVKVLSLE
jgi:hypothetical protein